MQNPQGILDSFTGGYQQPSLLNQRLGSNFRAGLDGQQSNVAQNQINALMGMGTGGFGNVAQQQINALTSGEAGGDILPAAQQVYQQNLQQALQTQREFGGPRFAAESARQAGDLQQRALNEFNLFTGQLLEGQAQRRQAGVLGAGQLALGQGQLGMARQQLRAQNVGQAGQLALGQGQQGLDWLNSASQYGQYQGQYQLQQQQQIMQMLVPFLQSLFQAGGAGSAPVINQSPGFGTQWLNMMGQVGGSVAGKLG